MERRLKLPLDDSEDAPVAFLSSPEDIILQKLHWYQKGDGISDQQWQDVQGVLRVQNPTLDRSYLLHWAKKLGLSELMARAFSEAGLTFASPEKD